MALRGHRARLNIWFYISKLHLYKYAGDVVSKLDTMHISTITYRELWARSSWNACLFLHTYCFSAVLFEHGTWCGLYYLCAATNVHELLRCNLCRFVRAAWCDVGACFWRFPYCVFSHVLRVQLCSMVVKTTYLAWLFVYVHLNMFYKGATHTTASYCEQCVWQLLIIGLVFFKLYM